MPHSLNKIMNRQREIYYTTCKLYQIKSIIEVSGINTQTRQQIFDILKGTKYMYYKKKDYWDGYINMEPEPRFYNISEGTNIIENIQIEQIALSMLTNCVDACRFCYMYMSRLYDELLEAELNKIELSSHGNYCFTSIIHYGLELYQNILNFLNLIS